MSERFYTSNPNPEKQPDEYLKGYIGLYEVGSGFIGWLSDPETAQHVVNILNTEKE